MEMVNDVCNEFMAKSVDCVILKWALRNHDINSIPDKIYSK